MQVPERDSEMQQIALAGQKFAYRYLHSNAKAMYVRQAIIKYNELFEVSLLPRKPSSFLACFQEIIYIRKHCVTYVMTCAGRNGEVCAGPAADNKPKL